MIIEIDLFSFLPENLVISPIGEFNIFMTPIRISLELLTEWGHFDPFFLVIFFFSLNNIGQCNSVSLSDIGCCVCGRANRGLTVEFLLPRYLVAYTVESLSLHHLLFMSRFVFTRR